MQQDDDAEIKFEYREQAVEFLDDMLKHKMFHRAKKIPVQEKEKKVNQCHAEFKEYGKMQAFFGGGALLHLLELLMEKRKPKVKSFLQC